MFNRKKNNLIKELEHKIECYEKTLTLMEATIEKLRNELTAYEKGEHVVGGHCEGCKHRFIKREFHSNGSWHYDYSCGKDRKAICSDFDGKEGYM